MRLELKAHRRASSSVSLTDPSAEPRSAWNDQVELIVRLGTLKQLAVRIGESGVCRKLVARVDLYVGASEWHRATFSSGHGRPVELA